MTVHVAPARLPYFTCCSCGAGLYHEPCGRNAFAFERWFASHGWDITTGRPFCRSCRPVVYGTYRVARRDGDDAAAAEGLSYTDVRADELTLAELCSLPIDARHDAEADLAHMEMVAALSDPTPAEDMIAAMIGADDAWAWRDHEHGGEAEPMAAE